MRRLRRTTLRAATRTRRSRPATCWPMTATDSTLTAASITGNTQGANGSVVYNGDGTFTYTPNLNFNGSDSFTYTVTDDPGATSTATVHLTVNPVNDAPVAQDDVASGNEDTAITTGNVLANDSDGQHADRGEHHRQHAGRQWLGRLQRRRHVHLYAEPELQRQRQLHLYRHRRPRRDLDGHGPPHGQSGERCAGCAGRRCERQRGHGDHDRQRAGQ